MNEQTEKLILELAEKLGTTAEHLWGVLVKQAQINAAIDLLIMIVVLGISLVWYRLVKSKTTKPPISNDDPYPYAEWSDEFAIIAWTLLAIWGVGALIALLCTISTVATALMNPEYWAIKQILP